MIRAIAVTESSVVAKSTPLSLNWLPVDLIKLSGRIGVAMNLVVRLASKETRSGAMIEGGSHIPWGKAIDSYQAFAAETSHQAPNTMLGS